MKNDFIHSTMRIMGNPSKFWCIEFAFCLAMVHNSHPLFVLEILIMMIVNMNSSFDVFNTRIVRKRYKLHMFKVLTYSL
jgi:hypothetical protein